MSPEDPDKIRAAASWAIRCARDLTPTEQDEFFDWLAADPRHGEQLARCRRDWKRLDRLAEWRAEHAVSPNPDLLAPPLQHRIIRFAPIALALGAAAALAFGFFVQRPAPVQSVVPLKAAVAPVPAGPVRLEDGTVIELNNGATIDVQYTAEERRVRLKGGEAHFTVAKNQAWPFIVSTRGVDIRAVGTAFNVRVDTATVEVLVTEGRVQVAPKAAVAPEPELAAERAVVPPLIPVLTVRQRAIVSTTPTPELPQIATLSLGEIDRVLSWQHRLLEFDSAPLSGIVAEFNRRNVVQIILGDAELAVIRLTGSFRTDNIDAFVGLVQRAFSVRSEYRSDTEIVLRKADTP